MLEFFKQIDKQKHILVLLIIVFIVGVLLYSIALGVLSGLTIGLLKEACDDFTHTDFFSRICRTCKKGTFDHMDFVADFIGIAIGTIALLVLGVPL